MPEYLSPGVFVEEIPSSLKAIEGVSTSTAAFVGRSRRGTVPGYVWTSSGTPLPFTPTDGFVLAPDPSPVLVTSFAQFQREFGLPWPIPLANDPNDYGYLGWAVRAFFDNGGKRAYIARITSGDQPSTMRVAQGPVYRLARSAAAGDGVVGKPLFFSSTRGFNVNDVITFRRHSDGLPALGSPAGPAIAISQAGPFALKDNDHINVVTNTPAATVTAIIQAQPASVQTAVEPFTTLADGATLQLRIGAITEPVQTITFSSADPVTPITPLAATAGQVQAVISRYASGVRVFVNAGHVVIETDLHGTAARLEIMGGTGMGQLGLAISVHVPAGGNVPDVDHVTVAQLAGLLASPNFHVDADPAGRLRFTSTATGAAVTIQVDEAGGNPGALQRLGFGAVASVTLNGIAGVSSTVQIAAYDMQSNSVTLTGALPGGLDVNAVYAVIGAPVAAAGPKFFARTPGSWSAGLQVSISNADRSATQVIGPVAVGQTQFPVQSVASLYVGATIEVDHNGSSRSIHEVKDVDTSTRIITFDPPLPVPALTVATPAWVRTLEIDVVINDTTGAAPTEVYRGLAWNRTTGIADVRRHYAWAINARSRLVWVQPPGVGGLPGSEGFVLASQPATTNGFPMKPDTLGTDVFTGTDADWVGLDNGPGARSGIESLKDLREARIIAAPGKSSQTIQLALITQCELLRYRFAILDGELDPAGGSITSILTHRSLYDTSFAALYQPWAVVVVDGQNRYLPPSGYLAGIYARVDNTRGVWKAPANESVFNIIGLKTYFTTGEQDLLNPRGVNLIREFDTTGIRVWGARTLASDPDVKYINVRRTLIFLEASIDQGTQWVVFEPNDPDTWDRLTASVSAFLLTQWRSGALFGRKAEEAFFVRCDESTMTSDDILNGRLICHIGVAIVRPAEFVIFRIEQITNFVPAK